MTILLSLFSLLCVFIFEKYQRVIFFRLKKQAIWNLVYVLGITCIVALKLVAMTFDYF